jgi:hypothetical protein
MRKISCRILAACLALASAPSAAQDTQQTPENAHRFLKMLSDGKRIKYIPFDNVVNTTVYICRGRFDHRWDLDEKCVDSRYDKRSFEVSSRNEKKNLYPYEFAIQETLDCKTSVIRNNAENNRQYWTEYGYIKPSEVKNPSPPHIRYLNDNGINWSRVSSVKADGTGVVLSGPAISGNYLKLIFESADLATRAAYAMEVIRLSCDATAATGF